MDHQGPDGGPEPQLTAAREPPLPPGRGSRAPAAPGLRNWALVMLLGLVWGSAFMGIAVALEGWGPWWVSAGRVAIGATTLIVVGRLMGQGVGAVLRSGRRGIAAVAAVGLVSVVAPFLLLAYGLGHVPSAFAGVAMGATPLMVLPLVAVFAPEEGIGPRRIAGVLLGFVGLVVLMGPGAAEGAAPLSARLACLGAAACYAVGSIVTRTAPPMPPLAFAAGTLIVAAAVLVPLALWREGWPAPAALRPALGLIGLGLFPTALAFALRVVVITSAGSLFMSMTSYMVPAWAVVFGLVLLGEAAPPNLLLALGLILAGIALAQSRALAAAWSAARGNSRGV